MQARSPQASPGPHRTRPRQRRRNPTQQPVTLPPSPPRTRISACLVQGATETFQHEAAAAAAAGVALHRGVREVQLEGEQEALQQRGQLAVLVHEAGDGVLPQLQQYLGAGGPSAALEGARAGRRRQPQLLKQHAADLRSGGRAGGKEVRGGEGVDTVCKPRGISSSSSSSPSSGASLPQPAS